MARTLALGSLCVVAVLVFAGFSPALASNPQSTTNALVPIEVTQHFGGTPLTTRTMVSPQDAKTIQSLVVELSSALDHGDRATAVACVAALQSYGVAFGPQFLTLMTPQNLLASHVKLPVLPLTAGSDENLSNTACLLNAHGQGMLLGPFTEKFIQQISKVLHNATNIIEALVLLVVFLPFIVVVVLLNALVPLRFMMPHGVLVLSNGTISTKGSEGKKLVTLSGNQHASVNVSFFTGISLSILPLRNNTKGFCFIYGFAGKTEGYLTES